ncbi:hypothetical protein PLEOSDRAFT_172177 [Pleurotus ostreatus PC15]|uniref:Uncharacterized protein n=1 Tax=Pleurotus ostreatus (strain PC15) TaxID=1137138 RepID=A0A067NFP6_PLEO1|nr:hypothetical protein PLEOSDRAFT_172177 [Pleurotus ostreatus PC15]
MSTVFIPSNGSMVLPPTTRSYGFPVPVQHAAYPATHTMMPGMMPGMPPMQGMRPVYGSAVGVPAVVPPYAYGGSYAGSSYVGAPSTVPRRGARADAARARVHVRGGPVLRRAAAPAHDDHHPESESEFVEEAQEVELVAFVALARPVEEQGLLLGDLEAESGKRFGGRGAAQIVILTPSRSVNKVYV